MTPTFAEALLQGYGISRPEDIDLEAIAFDQGATVKYRELESCEARIVGHGLHAVISVNSHNPPDRKRFSLAHELGHWIQDKGTVSLACTRSDIGPQRAGPSNSEALANEFASQVLMPDYMFRPISAQLPLTFETATKLKERFQTSLTSTAIKLVKTGHYPGMVVCYRGRKFRWAVWGPDVPRVLQPVRELDDDSQAFALLQSPLEQGNRPILQSADTWIDLAEAEDHTLVEHSILVTPDTTVSLLWWKNESQIKSLQHQKNY